MLEAFGNIWDHPNKYGAIVITTNGIVKNNGEAVMGRGIALEAKQNYPDLPKRLGNVLKQFGNITWLHEFDFWNGEEDYQKWVITLPVKHHWKDKADIELIQDSIFRLVAIADEVGIKKIIMPRPGCGNGGLKWEDVKPVIEPYLDDRFTVMERA